MYVTRASHTAGNFEFQLDHQRSTAYIRSIEGGWSRAQFGAEGKTGESARVATVSLEPITFEFGATSAPDMLRMIQQSWRECYLPVHTGQISYADFNLGTTLEHEFSGASLTETVFPTLDGASKEGGYIKCTLLPTEAKTTWHGNPGPRLYAYTKPTQKMWSPSAFRLTIDGVAGMEYTNKIEEFSIKTNMSRLEAGAFRLPELVPCTRQFPRLTGTISLRYAQALQQWHEQYVGSKNGARQLSENAFRNGHLEFLTPDRKSTMFSIQLTGVAPLYVGLMPSTANAEQIQRFKFELYVRGMSLIGSPLLGFA